MLKKIFAKNDKSSIDYIVVGLGNPGDKYEKTRHNAGFLAIDAIGRKHGFKTDRIKFKALTAQANLGGKKVLFMKPTTFMNLSGQSIFQAMSFYKVPLDKVIVLYDDISLEPGKLRIRNKGSHGGHNGIKSIIHTTGYDVFPRIKIGVGSKPHPDYDLADWVLSKFTDNDFKALATVFDNCDDIIKLIMNDDGEKAMSKYNS